MDRDGEAAEAAGRARDAWLAGEAWEAGIRAGRTLAPGVRELIAVSRWTAEGRAGMVYGLFGLIVPGDHPDALTVADACCEAMEMAAGHGEDTVLPGERYLPGHDVVTASGRPGVLTGEAGTFGYPRVRFADGTTATVPRKAIASMVVHVQWGEPPVVNRLAAPADVLLRPGGAAVMFGGTWVPTTSRLAGQMTGMQSGRYRESLLAARLLGGTSSGVTATAVLLADGGGPRPLVLLEPPPGLAAAPQGRDEASLLTRLLVPRGMHVLLPGQETPSAGPGWTLSFPAPGVVSVAGPRITLYQGVLSLPPGWEKAARARGAEVLAGVTGLPGDGPDATAAITAAAAAGRLAGARIHVGPGPGPVQGPPARNLKVPPAHRKPSAARRRRPGWPRRAW